jgi:hypothetical protein
MKMLLVKLDLPMGITCASILHPVWASGNRANHYGLWSIAYVLAHVEQRQSGAGDGITQKRIHLLIIDLIRGSWRRQRVPVGAKTMFPADFVVT